MTACSRLAGLSQCSQVKIGDPGH